MPNRNIYASNCNKKYNLDFKKDAIDYAEIHGNRPAAREFKVDEKRIREWRIYKHDIVCLLDTEKGHERCRLLGGGRKPCNAELEKILLEWIDNQRSSDVKISSKLIMDKAESVYRELTAGRNKSNLYFKASKGWLHRFLTRNKLSLRRMKERKKQTKKQKQIEINIK